TTTFNFESEVDDDIPCLPGSAISSRAGRRYRGENSRFAEVPLTERGTRRVRDSLPGVGLGQRDRGAAEASAGHPCADGSRLPRGFHREVELGARHAIVVAQAFVGSVQERADRAEFAGPQVSDGGQDALVLGDDVAYQGGQL